MVHGRARYCGSENSRGVADRVILISFGVRRLDAAFTGSERSSFRCSSSERKRHGVLASAGSWLSRTDQFPKPKPSSSLGSMHFGFAAKRNLESGVEPPHSKGFADTRSLSCLPLALQTDDVREQPVGARHA